MRAIWLLIAAISLAAAAVVWSFASGWAGRIPFYPDLTLLGTGEWPLWIGMLGLMYGPIAFAIWAGLKAVRNEQ